MKTNWYKEAIIYQIYPRSFKDNNGDGLGDLPGIIEKIPYLKDLGVTCVWLSPIYDSPQEDNGYDISNYKDIYPPFGTLDDFKVMIKKMHEAGIKLIMDLVVNHTSSQHPWFQDVLKNKDSKYKDYYIIKKGKKNGKKPPNNWQGFFSGSVWEKLPNSDDEYYMHLFAKGQPDLNWDNPRVREEVKDILRFWFDLGVDGFRCDVINLISKKDDFRNRFPRLALTGKDAFINGPNLHKYLKELNDDVISKYDVFTVGEGPMTTLNDVKLLAGYDRGELDMVFNFNHVDVDDWLGVKYFGRRFSVRRFKKIYKKWQLGLKDQSWNTLFIENHDQRRSVGRFGTKEGNLESAKMLALTYLYMQGTPFIYQGQEIGMRQAHFKDFDEILDVESHMIRNIRDKFAPFKLILSKKRMIEYCRDNARTPMEWDDSEYAGFSKVEPWLRVNSDYKEVNVKNNLEDKNSLYYFYQELIKIRKQEVTLNKGDYVPLYMNDSKVFAYKRVYQDEEFIIVSNFSDKQIKRKFLSSLDDKDMVLSNYDSHVNGELKPYECRLYKRKAI